MALAAVGVQAGIAFAAQSVELADGWEFRRGIVAAEKCRLLAGVGEISSELQDCLDKFRDLCAALRGDVIYRDLEERTLRAIENSHVIDVAARKSGNEGE